MADAFAIWITGLPASGKSTLARAVSDACRSRGVDVAVLESDALRPVLTPRLSYGEEDREGFYRALVFIGALLVRHGASVIFDATANRRKYRAPARAAIGRFAEVYVECPPAVCAARDPKGLYRGARDGNVTMLPGVQAPYEPPEQPDVTVSGRDERPEAAAGRIVRLLEDRGWLAKEETMGEGEDDVRRIEDPEGTLERAFIDEFLRARGYDWAGLRALPEAQRKHLLEEASTYAASKLTEVEARAQYVHHLHGEE